MRARSIILMTVTWLLTSPADTAEIRRILTNHFGYETDGPKRAVVQVTVAAGRAGRLSLRCGAGRQAPALVGYPEGASPT